MGGGYLSGGINRAKSLLFAPDLIRRSTFDGPTPTSVQCAPMRVNSLQMHRASHFRLIALDERPDLRAALEAIQQAQTNLYVWMARENDVLPAVEVESAV
jgi:hypothetical protein